MAAPVSHGVVAIFLAFALTYFLSALLRAVTATLAPVFSAELGIGAAQLGLLAGAYFLGFAAMQLPLGAALDRHGPRRTLLTLLAVAVLGCAAFAMADSFATLVAARLVIGVGVAACLMAPLTCYRRVFDAPAQLRANSWMLMTGSLGMVASTLPVQWLLPHIGWRGLFWALALALLVGMAVIRWIVPADAAAPRPPAAPGERATAGYLDIVRHPEFLAMAPLGFFLYGGMIAVQALWAGPWLTRVSGWSSQQAAAGLFAINVSMLLAFLAWGAVMPRLVARGWDARALLRWGTPLPLLLLAFNIMLGADAVAWTWALWCVSCTVVSLSQPAVGQAFAAGMAGRALSAFNLVIFGGVFAMQWGIGLVLDALNARGLSDAAAFRCALAGLGACCVASYLWYLRFLAHRSAREAGQ